MIPLPIKKKKKKATQGVVLFKDVDAGYIKHGVDKWNRSGGSKHECRPAVCQPPTVIKEEEDDDQEEEDEAEDDEEEEDDDQDDTKK